MLISARNHGLEGNLNIFEHYCDQELTIVNDKNTSEYRKQFEKQRKLYLKKYYYNHPNNINLCLLFNTYNTTLII